jgi:hypothetical protein
MSVWTAHSEPLESGRGQRISLREQRETLTCAQVIDYWCGDGAFRAYFSGLLAGLPYDAFLWEMPPLIRGTLDRAFECVVVDSPPLARARTDAVAFAPHFNTAGACGGVVRFPNLGADALLIAPCPEESREAYVHLAAFVRAAPVAQQHGLWMCVGEEVMKRCSEQPIWVSTSGLGVHWLHVRLDSFPKYYSYGPYRQYP